MIDLADQFERLGAEPVAVHAFTNDLPVVTDGGHLQGVQSVPNGWVVSASSSDYSWLAHVRRGCSLDAGRVVRIQRLLAKPMKHAGGFQVNGNLLAVGIEDNETRMRSEVRVYLLRENSDLDAPETIIERRGARERATAGAVAIAPSGSGHLLVVGDWDSRHLDVYLDDPSRAAGFSLVDSIRAAHLSRAGWSDEAWHNYQNLNLFPAGSDRYYLVGTTARGRQFGVVDLFELSRRGHRFELRKLGSRKLEAVRGASLAWGGGVCFAQGRLSVFATARTLEVSNVIVEYSAG